MEILIGTTNPAKINRFSKLLSGKNIRFVTPVDLGIKDSPEETGKDPVENACIKAQFYAQFCEHVICNDSGLYFRDIDLLDPRQPGLHVRTPYGKRLNDEEMIDYYAALAHELGGRITAYYLDAIAVSSCGKISVYKDSEDALTDGSFYILDIPSPNRTPGWPLDSLSVNKQTGIYFVDGRADAQLPETRIKALESQSNFLLKSFFT